MADTPVNRYAEAPLPGIPPIGAVIAAAGRSTRMGEPKQLLPWGDSTVLATVVANLAGAGAAPVVCVVGHRGEEMAAAVAGTGAVVVHNADYLQGEMLSSYQAGVRRLLADETAYAGTLLALGDQPHVPVAVIRQVLDQARRTPELLVVPSYAYRRGHPFYLPRRLWPALLDLNYDQSLRQVVRARGDEIRYVTVATDAILRDMDTQEEYRSLAGRQQQED